MRDRLLNDLVAAMKSKDKDKLSVVRMVKGAMQLEEINLKRNLNDEELIAVVAKQIKTRKESLVEFNKANREDLAEQVSKEIKILEEYMPEQLGEDEIVKLIEEAFANLNPTGPGDMGKIMGFLAPKIKGKADLGVVNNLIREKLNSL